jgi:hypothetical protein
MGHKPTVVMQGGKPVFRGSSGKTYDVIGQ